MVDLYTSLSMEMFNQPIMWQQLNACRHGQEVQLFFRPNVRMGNKNDLSDFDHGMIVGVRQGGLNISETTDFHTQHFYSLQRKHPMSSSSTGKKEKGQAGQS